MKYHIDVPKTISHLVFCEEPTTHVWADHVPPKTKLFSIKSQLVFQEDLNYELKEAAVNQDWGPSWGKSRGGGPGSGPLSSL